MDGIVEKTHNQSRLQNLDFVVWRVEKAKEQNHRDAVHRLLSDRPRLRRVTTH